jgi:YidC/Oxa1 family membrane protein insertase
MDRNTIFAFALIFATLVFFMSKTWNEKLGPALGLVSPPVRDSLVHRPSPPASVRPDSALAPAATSTAPTETLSTAAPVAPDTNPGQIIIVETDLYRGVLASRGGLIRSWEIKKYKDKQTAGPVEIIPAGGQEALALTAKENINLAYRLFETGKTGDTVYLDAREREQTITFTCRDTAEKFLVKKQMTFRPGCYDIGLRLSQGGLRGQRLKITWGCGIRESEPLEKGAAVVGAAFDYSEGYIKYGEEMDLAVSGKDTYKQIEGSTRWLSTKGKYFMAALIYQTETPATNTFSRLANAAAANQNNNFGYSTEYRMADSAALLQLYLGPTSYGILRSYGIQLERNLFQGYWFFFGADKWWPSLCGLLVSLLNFFYGLIPNYGVAIILLTIVVRIILFPLTIKQTRSMMRMKDMQPEITLIREKFKNEPLKMNQAIMAFYKERGLNPFTQGFGCLPMFLQMPIFIALYTTLRYAIELRSQPFIFWIHDLAGPEVMFNHYLPFSLPLYGNNVSLLNILMALSTYWQSKQTITDPKQKFMIYFMPGFMLLAMNTLPSGLLLYWTVSNFIGIGQNYLSKRLFSPSAEKAGAAAMVHGKPAMARPLTSLKEIKDHAKDKKNLRDPLSRINAKWKKK